MAAVQHRATTRTSNTDNSTTKTKSKATSARKSPATKHKRVSAETARAAAALKGLAVEAPAPSIEANEPGQFGRINVMDITPAEERGIFPARVELGEPFEMTAQVFIEGRTKVGATAIVRNPRGKETMRRAMTCVNPGLDRWTVMVKCGEHSDLKPWEDGYAAVKRQLGEWTVTIEGWEDAYVSWLHDARIKVRVMDDVDNALNSGAELLARWAETPDTGLTARDRKTLEKAAETMADQTLSAEDRLAAGDNPTIAALHETHPLRDGISPSQPQRFKVERPKSSFAAWYQFFPRSEGATIDPNTGNDHSGYAEDSMAGLERAAAEGFDIVYLPPVFPIGVTNRKGRNNTLVAAPMIRAPRSASAPNWVATTPLTRSLAPWTISRPCASVHMNWVWKSRLISPCSARPITRGSRPTRTGSATSRTAPSPSPRTRRRSIRTFTRSTSTPTCPASKKKSNAS